MVLKKEIMKTQSADSERGPEYRQMLVAAIHQCAVKFPEVASSVVHLLMDFLGDPLVRMGQAGRKEEAFVCGPRGRGLTGIGAREHAVQG